MGHGILLWPLGHMPETDKNCIYAHYHYSRKQEGQNEFKLDGFRKSMLKKRQRSFFDHDTLSV